MPSAARRFVSSIAFVLSSGIAACDPGGGTTSGATGAGAGAGTEPASCAPNNLTSQCTCGTSSGRKVCNAGVWGACECASVPGTVIGAGGGAGSGSGGATGVAPTFAGNARSDITFEWQSVQLPPIDGTCPPGPYEGNFQGTYWSIFAPGAFAVPIANLDPPGAPSGFHFVLEPAQGGETTQRVSGEMNGTADLAFPFVAKVEGELNCRTGTYSGKLLDGHYSVLIDGVLPQTFDGVMTGRYDKRTHTFVSGSWDVRESSANPPGKLAPALPRDFSRDGYGGYGDWAAASPTDVNDPNLKACPSNLTCGKGPLGPNKYLCNNLITTPTCLSDADCAPQFPGENVPCLKASLFSLCLRECKP